MRKSAIACSDLMVVSGIWSLYLIPGSLVSFLLVALRTTGLFKPSRNVHDSWYPLSLKSQPNLVGMNHLLPHFLV
jgi:hypothetical protein